MVNNQKQLNNMITTQTENNKKMELSIINKTKEHIQQAIIFEKEKILTDIKECVKTEANGILKDIGERKKSYADAIRNPTCFKSILEETQKEVLKVAKIEDISEERDRRMCASKPNNNVKESDAEDYQAVDNEWFTRFQKDIDTTSEFIGRIGEKNNKKNH